MSLFRAYCTPLYTKHEFKLKSRLTKVNVSENETGENGLFTHKV